MELEKTLRMNTLFSFYRKLLTDKQAQYLSDYYEEDYSLVEIAENYAVSRQAIYDSIKRTEKSLKDYEEKLQLVKEFEERQNKIREIKDYLSQSYPNDQELQAMLDDLILDRKREEKE